MKCQYCNAYATQTRTVVDNISKSSWQQYLCGFHFYKCEDMLRDD